MADIKWHDARSGGLYAELAGHVVYIAVQRGGGESGYRVGVKPLGDGEWQNAPDLYPSLDAAQDAGVRVARELQHRRVTALDERCACKATDCSCNQQGGYACACEGMMTLYYCVGDHCEEVVADAEGLCHAHALAIAS